jgi:hypothetical protein
MRTALLYDRVRSLQNIAHDASRQIIVARSHESPLCIDACLVVASHVAHRPCEVGTRAHPTRGSKQDEQLAVRLFSMMMELEERNEGLRVRSIGAASRTVVIAKKHHPRIEQRVASATAARQREARTL